MKTKLSYYGNMIKKTGPRAIFWLVAIPVLCWIVSVHFLNAYMDLNMQNIKSGDKLKAVEVATTFNEYLDEMETMIDTTATKVEDLLDEGAGYDEIRAYLEKESAERPIKVAQDTDGVYGYINGCYIDGYSWEPFEDFNPTQRLWYQEATAAKGKIIVIHPYIDVRTNNLVITVTKSFGNNEDVVAADVNLKSLQRFMDQIVEDEDQYSMVIDADGCVIAHTDASEVGLNYSEDDSIIHKKIFQGLVDNKEESFRLVTSDGEYLISQQSLRYGLTAVTLTNTNISYSFIRRSFSIALLVIIIVIFLIIVAILGVTFRNAKADDDLESLNAIAGIYTTMHKINLEKDTFAQIHCNDYKVSEAIGDGRGNNNFVLKETMKQVTDKKSLDEVLTFVDLTTLNERMAYKNTITVEFLNYEHLWYRGRFIVIDRLPNGNIKSVIWAVELIDDEKRYRDKLQYLAETDQLTGISNRGSGEAKIRDLLRIGKGGMFILFDVDKFKSINDTFGHDAGDLVLIAIASCMKSTFRDRDIIMRLGGDEYAVYIPGVYNKDDGAPIIQRFIKNIGEINIPETEGRSISISIGVAFYQNGSYLTFDELYKEADACTYESKKIQGCAVTYHE